VSDDSADGASAGAGAVTAAAGAAAAAAVPLRRRVGGAGFSARARFSRSHRARTRATCSSESVLAVLRTGTSIVRSSVMTSSAEMPNSPAMSVTRLLTPAS